jgi:hypothetical protein
MKSKIKRHAILLASTTLLAAASATAASTYTPGNLVLFFQQEGGTNTVYADLGKAADFRGTAAGAADGTSRIGFLDLNSTLTGAFGAGWASDATIYAGLAGVFSSNNTNATAVVDGDPYRTLYVSAARGSVGTLGEADSAGYTVNTNAGMTSGASGIIAMNIPFAALDGSAAIADTETSKIDDQNPFAGTELQGTAFSIFGGGVQQAGSASSFGSFGGAGSTEFALDLYRILARNTVSGQVAGDLRTGSYEGTISVGTNGLVSFQAVPEPSSLALVGLAAGSLVLRRRRSA